MAKYYDRDPQSITAHFCKAYDCKRQHDVLANLRSLQYAEFIDLQTTLQEIQTGNSEEINAADNWFRQQSKIKVAIGMQILSTIFGQMSAIEYFKPHEIKRQQLEVATTKVIKDLLPFFDTIALLVGKGDNEHIAPMWDLKRRLQFINMILGKVFDVGIRNKTRSSITYKLKLSIHFRYNEPTDCWQTYL